VSIHLIRAQDTLFLYTKHDCSVCKQTKQALTARGISFAEKVVETSANATEMLKKLTISGYKGNIYMPVIYKGKKLMHPAFSTDSGLVTLEINAVADSIIHAYRKGEIATIYKTSVAELSKNSTENSTSDCEHITGTLYLIAADYQHQQEAIKAVQILVKNGYPNAGFIHENGIYKVYLSVFTDFKAASEQLAIEKFKFTDAYLHTAN